MVRTLSDLVTWAILGLVLAATAGFAWLSHHPDTAIVAAAAEWPLVGGAARLFQARWLPPPKSVMVDSGGAAGGFTLRRVVIPVREVEIRDFFDLPDRPEDPRSIPWSRGIEPWTGSGPPPLGSDPVPALPMPGRPADPARLLEARSFFAGPPVEARLGAYTLLTDVEDQDLLDRMASATAGLEALYLSRYGLDPVGDPAETIVFYRAEQSYRQLQARSERIQGLASRGHVGWGIVALYADEGPALNAVVPVLRHELAHLLNRRSLGPALPPWLDEGIADDLAGLELDDRLAPRESPLGAMRRAEGDRVEIWGTLASLDDLSRAIATGAVPPLPSLLALDWSAFVEEPTAGLHYGASAWLVRYLLDDRSGLERAFRSFLRQVARGGVVGASELEAAIGRPWAEIEAGWRGYVAERALAAGVGAAVSTLDPATPSGSSSRQVDSPSA